MQDKLLNKYLFLYDSSIYLSSLINPMHRLYTHARARRCARASIIIEWIFLKKQVFYIFRMKGTVKIRLLV
jgi:hypothetical protein